MKAEHRKELETNLLADRMGHLIQRMKGGPQRRTIVYLFLAVLAIIIAVIIYYWWQGDKAGAAQRWFLLEYGELVPLIQDSENSNARKASKLEYLHFLLWQQTVAPLGSDPKKALKTLDETQATFTEWRDEYKGDPLWEAEIDYSLAIIEETRAAIDSKKLETARAKFEQVEKEHEKTPFGKLAGERKALLSDPEKFKQYREFYVRMNTDLNPNLPNLKILDDQQRREREKKLKDQDSMKRNPAPQ